MSTPGELLLGEHTRSLDGRFRVSLPQELIDPLLAGGGECILAKECAGCLSIWNAGTWQERLQQGVDLVAAKLRAGKLEGRLEEVQLLGRLLSTRHRTVQLAGRGRLLIPEGFREYLQVEPGQDMFVIGAAVCIELWNPKVWISFVESHMPEFRPLLDRLAS